MKVCLFYHFFLYNIFSWSWLLLSLFDKEANKDTEIQSTLPKVTLIQSNEESIQMGQLTYATILLVTCKFSTFL